MQLLENLAYNKEILFDRSFYYNGCSQRVYLSKSLLKSNKRDQYFLKVCLVRNNMICQGYIYFYLDFLKKTSHFIGLYVKPEYRCTGLASLLISNWVQFCLDNDFNTLTTNTKQRKPFLLYLLKTFGFEIFDVEKYLTSPYTIYICSEKDHMEKYLLFKNERQAEAFLHSSIMQHDNYRIIEELKNGMHILDNILLSTTYCLQNEDKAYMKSLQICNKHR